VMLRAVAASLVGGAAVAAATGLLGPVVMALEVRASVRANPLLNGGAAVEMIRAAMVQDGLIDA
jgi:hypothetical protein